MIDLHSHILPGLDDGVRSLDEARELAETAAAQGVTAIAATPHVRDDYPTTVDEMERGVERVREALGRAGAGVEVLTGGEVALDRLPALDDDELRRFTLGGTGLYLLIECPHSAWPLTIGDTFFSLRARGFTPILAHPERNASVQATPERLQPLVETGALVQVTAGAFAGRAGRSARAAAETLLARGLVHLVASDAHGPAVRAYAFRSGVEAIGDRALARWLAQDAPAAIVAGEALPDRPVPRRRWPSLLRR